LTHLSRDEGKSKLVISNDDYEIVIWETG